MLEKSYFGGQLWLPWGLEKQSIGSQCSILPPCHDLWCTVDRAYTATYICAGRKAPVPWPLRNASTCGALRIEYILSLTPLQFLSLAIEEGLPPLLSSVRVKGNELFLSFYTMQTWAHKVRVLQSHGSLIYKNIHFPQDLMPILQTPSPQILRYWDLFSQYLVLTTFVLFCFLF